MFRGPQLIHIPFFELITSDAESHISHVKRPEKSFYALGFPKNCLKIGQKVEKWSNFAKNSQK